MTPTALYQRSLPVKVDTDVFIAGGGPAGVCAAVAASRNGASVFLAEGFSAFGGAAVTMLVPAFMEFGNGTEFLAAGLGKEIFDEVVRNAQGSAKKYCPSGIPVETLKLCYDRMMKKSGAEFIFNTQVADVITTDGHIDYAVCFAKGMAYAVKAKVYVDCTGDGDMCALAGAEFEQGGPNHEVMGATLCGLWAGIDWSKVKEPDSRRLPDAFKDHVFSVNDPHLPGMWPIADGIGGANAGHVFEVDGTDAESLTEGILKARELMLEYRSYYREYLSGYENAELVCTAPMLGIRETRRIACDYRLSLSDFLARAVFEDEIGRYSYNVDIHAAVGTEEAYRHFEKEHSGYRYAAGESYGIPYRTMPVKNFDNLLTAGRCIFTDRYMQSSVRVMPGCFITGQAAGVAAAVCARERASVHEAPVHEIQDRLVRLGAYLPNFKN